MADYAPGLRGLYPLAAGVLMNLCTGILYCWSILVVPLEESLDAPRALVSAAPSLAFLIATIGAFVMHRLLAFFSLAQLALVTTAMSGVGLVIAGQGHSAPALLVGYGLLFGFGGGVAYFLAMTASAIEGPIPQSVAISINMAALAIGGIIWAPVLTVLVAEVGPHDSLAIAGLVLIVAAMAAYVLLRAAKAQAPPASGSVGLFQDFFTERPRIVIALFFGFFFVALASLTVVGHAATILKSWGASEETLQFAPMANSIGYVGGALLGGPLTVWLGGRRVLAGIGTLAGSILLVLYFAPGIAVGFIALAVVGACFGATASTHPVAISGYYGGAALARVYGRVALAYGFGGLLGPFVAGAIFDAEGVYGTVILLTAISGLVGGVAYGSLPPRGAVTQDAAGAERQV